MMYLPRQAFATMMVRDEAIQLPLSDLERQVVFLSFEDQRHTAVEERPLRRLLRRLFGRHAPNRLADPRLEALRVFCVRYRHDPNVINQQVRLDGPVDRFLEQPIMLAAAQAIDRIRILKS